MARHGTTLKELHPGNKVIFMAISTNRRRFLAGLAASVAMAALIPPTVSWAAPGTASEVVEVWKSATCGCCTAWVDHLRAAGFAVMAHDEEAMDAVKAAHGVPRALRSCHTALVGGYVIEGHVPAADLRRLLAERPQAAGLAVAGMPQDAPGMDMNTGEPFQVVLFGVPAVGTGGGTAATTRIFASY